jgi:E3 ubiquitin-protein ligase RNF1/2
MKIQSQNRATRIRKNAPENETANSITTTPNVSAPSTPTPTESVPSSKKKPKLSTNLSENESTGSGAEGPSDHGATEKLCEEQSGPSCSGGKSFNEIELVFKPHPVEMGNDNDLIKALKENSIRYIKTTSNATGALQSFISFVDYFISYLLYCIFIF